MKNILLILVGGTICTALNEDGMLSVSGSAGIHLKENFFTDNPHYKNKVNIDLSENLLILSENMTVDNWNKILNTYRKHIEENEYDGVIFAHGTDTLAYSSALFSLILSGTKKPIFFVSANERLESKRSNGNRNFKAAVECIYRGISPNVYVAYENISDKRMYLHLASRLEQCRNYSEHFYSCGAIDITDITDENYKHYFDIVDKSYPQKERKQAINVMGKWQLYNKVLKIEPYVGIDYNTFDYSRFSAVLHGTYHSGTACSEKNSYSEKYGSSSVLFMIDKCSALTPAVDTYLSPSKLSGEVYETTGIIAGHSYGNKKIKLLYGTTNEMAYAKLLLAYSLFESKKEIADFLNSEYNFEFIV